MEHYNDITLKICNKQASSLEKNYPLIDEIFPNSILINKLPSFKTILSDKSFYFYKNKDLSTIDKLKSLLISILGKNIRSKFCSLRKNISYDLVSHNKEIVFIFYGSAIKDLLEFHTNQIKNLRHIQCMDGSYSKYLWSLERFFCKQKNDTVKLCYVYNCFSKNFVNFLHKIYPNAIIVNRYHDMIEKRKHVNFIKKYKEILNIETYSLKNSSELNIDYVPNSVDPLELKKLQKEYPNVKYDVFFLGRVDNDRLNVLIKIAAQLKAANLTYKFYTVLNKKDSHEISDPNFVNSPLPYNEYLKELCQSRVVIDLYRISSDEGLSFRTAEAIILNKKTITNRNISKYNFYNHNSFLILKSTFDDIKNFITPHIENLTSINLTINQEKISQQIENEFNFIQQVHNHLKKFG